MGEMTNEEAIALLQDQMNFNRTMQRNGSLYANQYKEAADALELAINALRAGGKDMNVPIMPGGQPLTLEQLQGMVNRPVLIYRNNEKRWFLLFGYSKENGNFLFFNSVGIGRVFNQSNYEIDWIAYAYPPAHIDRGAWTSEWINSIPALGAGDLETRCKSCGNLVLFETDFCPYCGKAMTEEAWEKLEKRVRG